MVRFLLLALLAVLVYLMIRAVVAGLMAGLRGTEPSGRGRRALMNELVKDPVCETYVPRRAAVVRTAGTATYYFCSPACAAKFTPST